MFHPLIIYYLYLTEDVSQGLIFLSNSNQPFCEKNGNSKLTITFNITTTQLPGLSRPLVSQDIIITRILISKFNCIVEVKWELSRTYFQDVKDYKITFIANGFNVVVCNQF
jgi:hypothetical protein